ncbi:MAG: hypothetical protein AAB367_00015 [Patescibacteria group bacterium]
MPRIVIVFLIIIGVALAGTLVTFIVLRNQADAPAPQEAAPVVQDSNVFFSDDGGATWKALAGVGEATPRVLAFKSGGSGQLYIGTERAGLFIVRPGSSAVEHVHDPKGVLTDDARITALAQNSDGTQLFIGATQNNRARVIKLTEENAEEIFTASLDRFDITGVAVNMGDASHITIAVADGTVFETRDGGRSRSWEPISRVGTGIARFWDDGEPEGVIWVLDSKGSLFQSDSRGRLWKELPRPSFDGVKVSKINNLIFHTMRQALLAATNYGLGESRDEGFSWAPFHMPIPAGAAPITAIAVHPHFAEVFWATASNQIYRTDDGGITWRQTALPEKKNITLFVLDSNQPKHLYAGTTQ